LETELIDRSHVFANVENAVPAANRGVVAAEKIIGEAHARADAGGDAVIESRSRSISAESGHAELVHAFGIDEGVITGFGEVGFHVADVAGIVGPGAEELGAQAEIQS
jgi:hypothetical protein